MVATAPQVPLPATTLAEEACAVLAASAGVSEVHASRAVTANIAAVPLERGAPTAVSFR